MLCTLNPLLKTNFDAFLSVTAPLHSEFNIVVLCSVLLAATGVDANGSLYPLAYAVVDAENDDNWLWMLRVLRKMHTTYPSRGILLSP